MKKALIAAAACGALLAGQALADTSSATANLGDRVGDDAGASSNMAGMTETTGLYFLLAIAAIGGAAYLISDSNNGNPSSP